MAVNPASGAETGQASAFGQQPAVGQQPVFERPSAVLFDRDGTLVVDVPYNGDPELVELMPGALEAVELVRGSGVPIGVVTNQSAIGHGWITRSQADSVNARVEDLLGPFGTWQVCPHTADDACACRKPRPGMVLAAADALGVDPRGVVVIGDIEADLDAARAAGARGILVPTPRTRAEEVAAADVVAVNLLEAVTLALGDRTVTAGARQEVSAHQQY